jgi:hypothetical protein
MYESECAKALRQLDEYFEEEALKSIKKKDMVELKCNGCCVVESRELYCPYTGMVFSKGFTYRCMNCGATMEPRKYYLKTL